MAGRRLLMERPVSRKSGSQSKSKAPSQRQLRMAESIRQILSELLLRGDIHAAELSGVSVTVSEVRISPDLKNATAFCLPLGGGDAEKVVAALNRVKAPVRGMLGKQLTTRYTPSIHFELDTTFDYADSIDALLKSPDVADDLGDPEGVDPLSDQAKDGP